MRKTFPLIRIFWLAGFASLLAVSPLLTQNAHAQRHELHASDGSHITHRPACSKSTYPSIFRFHACRLCRRDLSRCRRPLRGTTASP